MKKLIPVFSKHLPLISIIFVFILQLPFLDADADSFLSIGVGPWTDEGLYTLQLRNFVNLHSLNFIESDGFLKAPLYNVMLFPLFSIFGSKWMLTRIFLVLSVLTIFYAFTRQNILNKTALFFVSAVLLQYHVFHYTHLVLCEMIAIAMLLFGFAFYVKSMKINSKKYFLAAFVLVSLAAFIKIIFVYFLILIPLSIFIESIVNKEFRSRIRFKQFLISFGIGMLIFIIFISSWYFLNHDFFIKIIFGQSEISYGNSLKLIFQRVAMNRSFYSDDLYFQSNIYLFYANLIFVILLFSFRKKIEWEGYVSALIFSGCWLLIEVLKLGDVYLPSRYLVSGIIANLLFTCIALELLLSLLKKYALKIIYIFSFVIFLYNIHFYILSHQRRSFGIRQINEYLSKIDFNGQPIMGNWAASCSWNCNAYIKPLSIGFNDINTINLYHPKAIVKEICAEYSEKALVSNGINLIEQSDSIRTFKMNQWTLAICWIKQK